MKKPTEKDLRLTVIEAATYTKRFDPLSYNKKYRSALIKQANKLVDEGHMRWEVLDNGNIIYTLE